MQRTSHFYHIFIACSFILLVIIGSIQGNIIPIAIGNTWVYKYSDTVVARSSYYPPTVTTQKEGTHTMIIDTAFNISDSVFFTLITIDSGASYFTHSVNLFKIFKDSLYKMDTGLISWVPYCDEFLCYRPHCDTNHNWQVISFYDPKYLGVGTIYGIDSHSDTISIIINNAFLRKSYLSDTVFSWEHSAFDFVNGEYIDKESGISRDTSFWIDSIGLFYHINNSDSSKNVNVEPDWTSTHFRETFYLYSFNGITISFAPITTGSIAAQAKHNNTAPQQRNKLLNLKTTPFKEILPASYFNLLGRKQFYFKNSQILIMINSKYPRP